ncbi:MAG: sigma factor, partial [Pseudomonadota bacterium]
MTDDTQVPEQAPPAKDAVVSSETDTDATVDSRTTAKGRPCRAAEEAVSDISEASDAMLLAAIAEDASRAAFVELFGRYAGRIKAFLLRSGAAHDEAEDSAQEVMVTVWRRAGQFDSTKAAV